MVKFVHFNSLRYFRDLIPKVVGLKTAGAVLKFLLEVGFKILWGKFVVEKPKA